MFDLIFFQKHGQTDCSSSSVYCTPRYVICALFDDPYVNFPFLFIGFEKVNFFKHMHRYLDSIPVSVIPGFITIDDKNT